MGVAKLKYFQDERDAKAKATAVPKDRWQVHTDPNTKQLLRVNTETGEVQPVNAPEPAPVAGQAAVDAGLAGTPKKPIIQDPTAHNPFGWKYTPFSGLLDNVDFKGVPTAKAFNAAQDESDAHPFVPPALRGALAAPAPAAAASQPFTKDDAVRFALAHKMDLEQALALLTKRGGKLVR